MSWMRTAVMVVFCCVTTVGAQQPSGTLVTVLVDFSKSFAPLGDDDERALKELARAIAAASEESWTPPVTVHWSTITTSSLFSKEPCGPIEYQAKLIAGKGEIKNAKEFVIGLEECATGLVKLSRRPDQVTPFTDISGAIRVATERKTDKGAARVIVVLSDFVEDHPAETVPASLKMRGEHCVLLYRPESGDQKQPNRLFDRMNEWRARLLKAGALRVEASPIVGLTAKEIQRLLPE